MELTLSEIAIHVGGKVVGNQDCSISGVSEIQDGRPGTITFLANPLYSKYLSKTNADAVFVNDGKLLDGKNGIVVQNPQLAVAQALALFFPDAELKPFIDSSAVIAPTATIGNHVSIGPGAVIQSGVSIGDWSKIGANTVIGDNTTLGPNCTLHPNVSLYAQTIIGKNVIIHSGTSIGCDGYGYVTMDSIHKKIPQTGNVIIGNDVEIGSNCAIDRATIGSTSIGQMTKIDNLVHIAHNVKIGKGCLITAGFAVAGSSKIGNYCTFAGQVGVAPHLNIGDHSIVAAKSGITKSLKGGKVYAGFPAREIKEHNKREALVNEIGKLRQNLDQLIKLKLDK